MQSGIKSCVIVCRFLAGVDNQADYIYTHTGKGLTMAKFLGVVRDLFTILPKQRQELNELKALLGHSKSEIVRDAIDFYYLCMTGHPTLIRVIHDN